MHFNKACFILLLTAFSGALCKTTCDESMISDITTIRQWLDDVNKTMTADMYNVVVAEWNWATDINNANEQLKAEENAKMAVKLKTLWKEVACFDCEMAKCTDEEKRRLGFYESIDTSALPSQDFDDYVSVQTVMENIYSTATVCLPDDSDCLPLDPDLYEIIGSSNDYCELQWAWEGWRNETGRKMRGYYGLYIKYQNQAAEINGFPSAKDMWTSFYLEDEPQFYEQVEAAWQEVLPLYQELHRYALTKLQEKFGAENFPASGHIPAHLLGNMWAQDWQGLYPLLVPYPDAPEVDVTKLLIDNGWTEMKLFEESDRFFQSIGLEPMTQDFWEKSVFLKKPEPTEMVCHASAWDFYTLTDFRIKMCTTLSSFQTVHHEMGHIQYFMQYKNQYFQFRTGANPGFHEAIGDLIALSVMTPGHLKTIGLLPSDFVEDEQTSMNTLMSMALDKITFLPFGYLMDKYRWDLFDQVTPLSKMNDAWWKLRCEMQGISPPVPRTEEDFDAGAKYHIPASVPYIRYFFSHVAQFQFHRSICAKMGYKKDFHKCDIYNNETAAKDFRDAMALGASTPYPQVMKTLTGSETLSASAILEYFAPLYDWLQVQNAGKKIAWDSQCSTIERNTCNYNHLVTTTPRLSTTQDDTTERPEMTTQGAVALSGHYALVVSLLAVILASL